MNRDLEGTPSRGGGWWKKDELAVRWNRSEMDWLFALVEILFVKFELDGEPAGDFGGGCAPGFHLGHLGAACRTSR